MGAKSIVVIAGVAVVTLLYLVYLGATYEPPEGTTTVIIPPPDPQPLRPEPEPSRPSPPQIPRAQVPADAVVEDTVVEDTATVEETGDTFAAEVVEPAVAPESGPGLSPEADSGQEPETVELPSLNASDAFVFTRLQQIGNGVALIQHLADAQLVRRFVVLVDNISRGDLPQNNLVYRNVPGDFPVQTVDDNLFQMDEAGYRRFDQAVNAFIALDTDQALSLYRLASPLLQQAYGELGFGDVNFDTSVRRAIRNVLDTEEIDGPLQLVKPSVMYLYADSQIEGMSDIQKQLIRIGPENREKVKAKLREFLLAL